MEDVSAFVLTGGKSTRLGADKALLQLGGRNFLQIALANAKAVCAKPVIVGSCSLYAGYGDVIEDSFRGCGPLGGIHAALSATSSKLNLVLSVDMPLMDYRFLQWLARESAACHKFVTVPLAGRRLQPLCAVYDRAVLPEIETALTRKQYRVEGVFRGARVIEEDEIRYAGFGPEIFYNVNTLCEYESLLARHVASTVSNAESGRR